MQASTSSSLTSFYRANPLKSVKCFACHLTLLKTLLDFAHQQKGEEINETKFFCPKKSPSKSVQRLNLVRYHYQEVVFERGKNWCIFPMTPLFHSTLPFPVRLFFPPSRGYCTNNYHTWEKSKALIERSLIKLFFQQLLDNTVQHTDVLFCGERILLSAQNCHLFDSTVHKTYLLCFFW